MATTDKPWDGSAARFSIEQWRRSCLIDRGGDRTNKNNFALPIKDPDGALNRGALAAAAGRLNQVKDISSGQRAAAARKLIEAYAQVGMTPPDHLKELAGSSASTDDDSTSSLERSFTNSRVELRSGDGSRVIGGYAATFNTMSRKLAFGFEQIDPGFFDESQAAGWPEVVARWDHDPFHLLGTTFAKTLTLAVDSRGLDYSVDVPLHREDVLELTRRQDIHSSSFAFAHARDEWEYRSGNPVRTLLSATIIDVAPVSSQAAYPKTSAALRSLSRHMGAPIADVKALAAQGELRRLFERSDIDGGAPARTLTTAQAGARLDELCVPRHVAIDQEYRRRVLYLHAKRAAWH
ncbi:HK97 family phage prohead protease [Mycobacterium sp.]|uniref:HK97 family phage prohead protease n=1 Tax=Mycobacterium sp. TaxID=1785 RepID=UPI003F99297D